MNFVKPQQSDTALHPLRSKMCHCKALDFKKLYDVGLAEDYPDLVKIRDEISVKR